MSTEKTIAGPMNDAHLERIQKRAADVSAFLRDHPSVVVRKVADDFAAIVAEVLRLRSLLIQIEQHCPCGARSESLGTHPHVLDCPVAIALGSPTVATQYRKAVGPRR